MPTFGSLFAGIGGIDLGLERAGWTCRWQVERDAYCQRVLAKHWPDVPRYGDITAIDWSGVERVDLLAGGFPCQPISVAGKRKAQADSRWLWPEFGRAVRDLRPGLVLVENVPGLLARGMGDVLGDLAALGYDADWQILSAADVGAPHLRKRVWIVAHASELQLRREPSAGVDGVGHSSARPLPGEATVLAGSRVAADAFGAELRDEPGWGSWAHWADPSVAGDDGKEGPLADAGLQGLPESEREALLGAGRRDEGRATAERGWWAAEPDVGRVAHGVPSRVDRLRGLGNAVVPQVAEVIGQQLMDLSRRQADRLANPPWRVGARPASWRPTRTPSDTRRSVGVGRHTDRERT